MIIIETIIVFYIGALMASFAYLLGMRLPRNESILTRSHCEQCQNTLTWYEILPIFGYVIRAGKCKSCQQKIPISYLLLEIFGGLLFLISFLVIQAFNLSLLIALILITVLLIESTSDYLYGIVIDRVWVIGLMLILVIRIIENSVWTYLLSSLTLFFILFAIALLGQWIFKKQALGGGDIKLYLFIGFGLNLYEGLLSIFVAAVIGLIYAFLFKVKSGKELAFVPMIMLATMICYWFGEAMINFYLNILGV